MKIQENTSIKSLFQSMLPDNDGVITGAVISTSPLNIQAANDAKFVLTGGNLCIPKHLTNYTTPCEIDGAMTTITIKNELQVGDIVYMLSFNEGKKYYILDREA